MITSHVLKLHERFFYSNVKHEFVQITTTSKAETSDATELLKP